MRTPGGSVAGWDGERLAGFVAPDGHLERLVDSADGEAGAPRLVTAILGSAAVGETGTPLGPEWSRGLSVGDRRHLLRGLLVALGRGAQWRTINCLACARPFDVLIDHRDLVPPPVAQGWPHARVTLSDGRSVVVTVPCGADEEHLAGLGAHAAASALLERCTDLTADEVEGLDASDTALVDAAIEGIGPDPILAVQTACPECGATAEIGVDPYALVGHGDDRLLREVHELASTYHWSEAAILSLPTSRRRSYLALVGESQGRVG